MFKTFNFFLVVAGLLAGGIVTLMVQNIRETHKVSAKPEERVLQVYRQTACAYDAALCERLMQSSKTLEEEIRAKQWEYDVTTYQEGAKAAAQLLKQQRYRDAFRESCKAMLLLMDTAHVYRAKHEGFKPVWDRPAS